jgi:hypothetical protein
MSMAPTTRKVLAAPLPGALLGQTTVVLPDKRHFDLA